MIRICVRLFLCVCFINDVLPFQLEDKVKESSFVESDYKVLIAHEVEGSSIEEIYEENNSEEHFNGSDEDFRTMLDGKLHKTVKRYWCSVRDNKLRRNNG